MRPAPLLEALLLAAVLAEPSSAQSTLFTWTGDDWNTLLGWSVDGLGDVDGDGVPDVVTGRPANPFFDDPGSVFVISGGTGCRIHTFHGDGPGRGGYGTSVACAGDVDGDGVPDVVVGAKGYVRVYSGATGATMHDWTGLAGDAISVDGAGDVNADGFADVVVGADFNPAAVVLSGRDGSTLLSLPTDDAPPFFVPVPVAGVRDVNGDGWPDVIVGRPVEGAAYLHSGRDGMVLHVFQGPARSGLLQGPEMFGLAVSGAGDVDADGRPDVIVGGKYEVRVFSGKSGSLLHSFSRHPDFTQAWGRFVDGVGDVDGDGYDDVVVGTAHEEESNRGAARVFSGRDGSLVYTLTGPKKCCWFGFSVSGCGDVDLDGRPDILVGAPTGPTMGEGQAFVHSGWSPAGTRYCSPASVNSTGLSSSLIALGSIAAAENLLALRATEMPPHQVGYLLMSRNKGSVTPPGSQGVLCLGGTLVKNVDAIEDTGPAGSLSIRIDLSKLPTGVPHTVQPGETWNFQCWYRDVNPGPTSNFTDAVSVTFR